MAVREVISEIRVELLNLIPRESGCFSTDIPAGEWAHPQGKAWDSWICRCRMPDVPQGFNIVIVIQYLIGEDEEAKGMIMGGRTYNPIRLAIYDQGRVPGSASAGIGKDALFANLLAKAKVTDSRKADYVFFPPQGEFGKTVGHVLDLCFVKKPNDRAPWNMPGDKAAFARVVKSALDDLMPIANCYVKYREELFRN